MKYTKLINELDGLLDSAYTEQKRHRDGLSRFLSRFAEEEASLHRRLKEERDEDDRVRIKRDLDLVKTGYKLLQSRV